MRASRTGSGDRCRAAATVDQAGRVVCAVSGSMRAWVRSVQLHTSTWTESPLTLPNSPSHHRTSGGLVHRRLSAAVTPARSASAVARQINASPMPGPPSDAFDAALLTPKNASWPTASGEQFRDPAVAGRSLAGTHDRRVPGKPKVIAVAAHLVLGSVLARLGRQGCHGSPSTSGRTGQPSSPIIFGICVRASVMLTSNRGPKALDRRSERRAL